MNGRKSVFIDARMVDYNLHGIARYTYELIKNISKANKIKFVLLVNDLSMARDIFKGIENIDYIVMKSKFLSLKEQIELPRILNKYKKEGIFHSPSFSSSPFLKIKSLMTIHDLNHVRFPQFYSSVHKYYYKYVVKPSALKSKRILTVSNFSKNEIKDWLNCKDEDIVVTYNGIDKSFRKIEEKETLNNIKNKYSIPKDFILYIGNQKPHKNVKTLIKAMADVGNDLTLVLNGRENPDLIEIAKELGIEHRVKFIGFVDDKDLSALYTLAKVFVFPSLYEGFGLPPLEAMACGCPAIVADTSSLTEVVGDIGIKFASENYKELAQKINYICTNNEVREKISLDGIDFIKKYSWEDTANITLREYEKILN